MLAQMKNVRDIPTSQGGTNNAGDSKPSADDSVFDALRDVDGNLDNMFGQIKTKGKTIQLDENRTSVRKGQSHGFK